MGIYSTVKGEWDGFTDNDVEIVDGYSFNQYETVKLLHRYHNSRFENGARYNGREKLFFNISKYRCTVASKGLNFDTKDIRLWPLNPESELATFLLEKELAVWMKKNKMGKLLNQLADELPVYGSVVLKKTRKGATVVDLRRFALDPTVANVVDSRFVVVKHYLTEPELRKKAADGWDEKAIAALIATKGEQKAPPSYSKGTGANQVISSPYFEVYERYGELSKSDITGKGRDAENVRSLAIVAEPISGKASSDDGLVLFKSEWRGDWPFRDCHYTQTKGRWLGIGVIEDLIPAQERVNEMANQKRVSMEISGMHLFQTTGTTVLSNLLEDLKNGDVLKTGINSALTPIATEERNLAAFETEQRNYDSLADRLSFSYDVARGESLPASTPVTNTIIQNQNVQSVFAYKRENLGLMLQEFFNETVLPQLKKDLTAEHKLRFTGSVEDLAKLDRMAAKTYARNRAVEQILDGKAVTREDVAAMEADAERKLKSKGANRFVDVASGLYRDAEFEFDFMVTNEQENVSGMANNLFQLLTSLAQNPQLLDNPTAKALLYEYAQKIGISPMKLELADGQRMEGQAAQAAKGQPPMPQAEPQPVPRLPTGMSA